MKTLRLQILENLQGILKTYQKTTGFYSIAEYIFKNVDNRELWMNKLSIFELAALTNTSGSTVTRFCQKIGLTGFKELGVILRATQPETVVVTEAPVTDLFELKSGHEINDYISWAEESIFNNKQENSYVFNEIHNNLTTKKRIFFFGFNDNVRLIQVIIPLLERVGFDVFFTENYHNQKTYLDKIRTDDLVIIISLKLEEKILQEVINKIVAEDLEIIIITGNWKKAELDKIKNKYILKVSDVEDRYLYLEHATSETTIIFLLKLVFISLLDEQKKALLGKISF